MDPNEYIKVVATYIYEFWKYSDILLVTELYIRLVLSNM